MFKTSGGRAARKMSASLIALMTGVVVTAFAVPVSASATGGPYSGFSSGTVAEVGLGVTKTDPNQLAPFVSQVASNGGHKVDDKDPLHVPGSPLIWVDGLHTAAVANWNTNTCVIGEPISAGFSRAAAADA